MDYKKAFYSRLEDCYLGAKIKQAQSHHATLQESKAQDEQANQKAQRKLNTAQSGFTNLLMIKERYFTHIKAHLEARIKALVGDDIIETNDIYNKLYTFFDNYLNETGTPFFTDTPIYKNIYAKIYSNSKDTSLFYKTQNLYYVKSDTLYQSLILQSSTGKFSLYFDASEFKQNADNNKNKVIFKFDDISLVSASEQDEKSAFENSSENSILQITIKVSNQKDLFPNLSAVFKSNSNEFSDEFLKTLSQRQIISKKPTQSELDELKKLFRAYKKQNEIDFFIHKDALGFLKEQFDLWMFSYLYKDSEFQEWSAFAIKRLQMVKNLAYELIEFIAKFENELKAIWLKPKFAKNTQYVFSIDTILSKAQNANTLLASIFEDANFYTQITEWKELNLVENDFDILSLKDFVKTCHTDPEQSEGEVSKNKNANTTNSLDSSLSAKAQNDKKLDISPMTQNEKYKFLPIDTKHLSKENKFALLNAFENLETLLNGELIKSDNFQALNTLMPKYQGKIDLIYIDPPYNAPASEIIYKNNFKDSTWLSMMQNRLAIAKDFLSKRGILTCAIDENEQENLGLLLSDIFSEYEKTCVSVEHNPKGIQGDNFSYSNEFAYFLIPNNAQIQNEIIDLEYKELMKTGKESERNTAKNCFYPIYVKDSKIIGFGAVCDDDFHPNEKIIDNGNFLEVYPLDSNDNERKWRYSRQSIEKVKGSLKAFVTKNSMTIKLGKTEKSFKTMWYGSKYSATEYGSKILKDIIPNNEFDYPKSIHTVKDSIYLASKEDSIVLDFFGGSGTTAHAVLELNKESSNRKFILVETGEHFYSVILPRIKKVAFSSEWKEGKLKENKQVNPIAIAFRYYELESYEEALANCEYVLNQSVIASERSERGNPQETNSCHTDPEQSEGEVSKKSKCGYFANAQYDNMDSSLSTKAQNDKRLDVSPTAQYDKVVNDGIIDYRKSRKLIKELNKEPNKPVTLNMSGYRAEFDIFQSIANLMGWKIKRLFLDNGEQACEYDNGEILRADNINLGNEKLHKLKNLIWWE